MITTTNPSLNLHNLSRLGRRRLVIRLRYELHWPTRRIARRMGITPRAVHRLLQRIASDPSQPPRIKPPRTRSITPFSLSLQFDL